MWTKVLQALVMWAEVAFFPQLLVHLTGFLSCFSAKHFLHTYLIVFLYFTTLCNTLPPHLQNVHSLTKRRGVEEGAKKEEKILFNFENLVTLP